MIWQEWVIGTAQLFFMLALFPAVFSRIGAPPLLTSIPTAAGLAAIGVAFASLALWYAAFTSAGSAALWAVLAIKRWSQR